MNARLLFVVALGLMLSRTGSVFAEVADLAALASARTVAYLELHDPPALARELHALIKGSYLRHPALYFANYMKQGKKVKEEALLFAWFGSPEFIDELGDWQGGFLALTGFTKNEEPEMVGLLRTGKSRMLPLALRMFLLEGRPIRCIARVEGVPIFQIGDAKKRPQPPLAKRLCAPVIRLAELLRAPRKPSLYQVALLEDAPVEEPEEMPDSGFFLSLLPGAIAFGTTPDVLSDAIRRYKGKPASPSLAAAATFRAAAELRRRPGFFAWCDPPRITRLINDALRRGVIRTQDAIGRRPLAKGEKRDAAKIRKQLRQVEIEHRRDTQEWTFFQKAANLAGMNYAAAACSLHKGEFACRIEARMREKQTNLLFDVPVNEKLNPDLLQAVPGDAFCLFAVPLQKGAATLARVLKLADAYMAECGEESPLPSRSLAELEKQLKLRLGSDVLGKMRSVAVALHLVEAKETRVFPMFIVEAASETAAKDLLAAWPRIFAAGGERIEPHYHTIDGQRIRSLTDKPEDASRSGLPPYYGHHGKIVVLGWHRGSVAETLREIIRKKDLLNLPHGLAAVDAEGAVNALGLFSCRQLLAHITQIVSTMPDQDDEYGRALSYLREMSTPMAAMPPTMFCIKRLTDGARIEFRQSELPIASATVVDILLTCMLDTGADPSVWLFSFLR